MRFSKISRLYYTGRPDNECGTIGSIFYTALRFAVKYIYALPLADYSNNSSAIEFWSLKKSASTSSLIIEQN